MTTIVSASQGHHQVISIELLKVTDTDIGVCHAGFRVVHSDFNSYWIWLKDIYIYIYIYIYRVIHKSVKHFKNSQQIDYATDHGNSYADREKLSIFFFTYFTDSQCIHLW
jgi:hypothetical protein